MSTTSDKQYVLCEFLNEDKLDGPDVDRPVQICFAKWVLLDREEARKPIADLITEEVQVSIKYPTNHEVGPKEVMSKKTGLEWKICVAVIKAQSDDWVTISEYARNVIKYGKAEISKVERRELAKRKLEDVPNTSEKPTKVTNRGNRKKDKDCKDSSDEDDVSFDKPLSEITDKAPKNGKGTSKSVKVSTEQRPVTGAKADSSVASADVKASGRTVGNPIEDSSADESEDELFTPDPARKASAVDTENLSALSKKDLIAKVRSLQTEIRDLRSQNRNIREIVDMYKTMKVIAEDWPKLEGNFRRLIRDTSNAVLSMGKENVAPQANCPSKSSSKPKPVITSRNLAPTKKNDHIHNARPAVTPAPSLSDETNAAAQSRPTVGQHVPVSRPSCSKSGLDSTDGGNAALDSSDATEGVNIAKDDSQQGALPGEDTDDDEEEAVESNTGCLTKVIRGPPGNEVFWRFGDKEISAVNLQNIRHGGKITILAADLSTLLFTHEELALSSVNGKLNNRFSNGLPPRALESSRINAMIEYAVRTNPTLTRPFIEEKVQKALKDKLSNFKRSPKGTEIIEAEKRRLEALREQQLLAPENENP